MNEERLECGRNLCLQGCTHILHGQREREIKRYSARERKRRVFVFKRNDGALAPFSYIVVNIYCLSLLYKKIHKKVFVLIINCDAFSVGL
jgi:hypothetical protein